MARRSSTPGAPGSETAAAPAAPASAMTGRFPLSVAWAAAWLVLVAVALYARPPLPVDETRYLAMAWEMYVGGDYLVPHLNGATYSHKPPLLFWLINLGWALFGAVEWWARAVAPLFALGSLFLSRLLAQRLWPDRPDVAALAPVVLIGSVFWAATATLTLFDMLVCFFTLAALLGVADAARHAGARGWRGWRGWAVAGVALGLGILSKGPVALVYFLPAPLAAPLWAPLPAARRAARGWLGWYAGLAGAIVLGAALALAWALPAAEAGGEAYANAILWEQTAGRVSDSFAHERPWWFYLAMLAGGLLPWTVWPPLWRGLAAGRAFLGEPGNRFCLAWLLLSGIALSFISGKQPHYFAPALPAAALLVASALDTGNSRPRRLDGALPAILFAAPVVALIALLTASLMPEAAALPPWARDMAHLTGLPLALVAVVVAVWPAPTLSGRAAMLGGASVLFVLAAHLTAQPHLEGAFDVAPAARHAAAVVGKYHGQFHFPGRLEQPLDAVWEHRARAWAEAHPGGKLFAYQKALPDGAAPEFTQRYRNGVIAVWDAAAVAARPALFKR